MQTQTVYTAGNSSVVSIPKHLAEETGIKPGQKVIIEKGLEPESLIIKKITKKKAQAVSPDADFSKWYKDFIKENAGILDELALR